MRVTYLIVPAVTDQAGQCRIVSTTHDNLSRFRPALADYRDNPDLWQEAGLMNSRGRLVCLDALPQVLEDMRRDEPLHAGLTYTYDLETGEPT